MKTISTLVLLVLAGCDPCGEHERAIQIATPVASPGHRVAVGTTVVCLATGGVTLRCKLFGDHASIDVDRAYQANVNDVRSFPGGAGGVVVLLDDGTLWFDNVLEDPVPISSPPFIRITTDAAGHQVCGTTMDRRFFCMHPNGVTNWDAAWVEQDVVNVGRAAVGRGEVFADGDVVWFGHPSGFGWPVTCEPGFARVRVGSEVLEVGAFDRWAWAVLADGSVRSWGDDVDSTRVDTLAGVASVCAGDNYSCGITIGSRQVVCTGANTYGVLGNGISDSSVWDSMTINTPEADEIVCDVTFACAHTTSRGVWCWGRVGSFESLPVVMPTQVIQP